MDTPNGWLIAVTIFSALIGAYATLRAARTEKARTDVADRSQAFQELESLIEFYREDNTDLRRRNHELERRRNGRDPDHD